MAARYAAQAVQRGAALILAMLVVALVSVLAIGMSTEHWITMKRSSNQIMGEVAYSYLRAAEQIAIRAMEMDLEKSKNEADFCQEPWALDRLVLSLAEGAYEIEVEDLSGRFNINNLVDNNSANNNKAVPYTVDQARFIRLLQSFNGHPDLAEEVDLPTAIILTEAVMDWLDSNRIPRPSGAEDGSYDNVEGQFNYLAANQPMVSISELNLIANMPADLYRLLKPHITVWPINGGDINVNTATPQVLRSLNVYGKNKAKFEGSPLSLEDISAVRSAQQGGDAGNRTVPMDPAAFLLNPPTAPFSDIDTFKKQAPFDQPGFNTTGLDVKSNTFLLKSRVELGDPQQEPDFQATRLTVIARSKQKIHVLARADVGDMQIEQSFNNWCRQRNQH